MPTSLFLFFLMKISQLLCCTTTQAESYMKKIESEKKRIQQASHNTALASRCFPAIQQTANPHSIASESLSQTLSRFRDGLPIAFHRPRVRRHRPPCRVTSQRRDSTVTSYGDVTGTVRGTAPHSRATARATARAAARAAALL